METIVGFVAGYLVGTRAGRDGLDRLRASWHSIRTSPEVRRLAGEAITVAELAVRRASGGRGGFGETVSGVTDILIRRAGRTREGTRAA